MLNKRCVIVGASRANGVNLKRLIRKDDFVISADGGLDACAEYGVSPNLHIGDNDSVLKPAAVKTNAFEQIKLSAEKDVTDLHAAVLQGLKRGYRKFILTGCLGRRFDHTLSAAFLLEFLRKKNACGVILDKYNRIHFYAGGKNAPLVIKNRKKYKYISIIPLDALLTGVTATGLKYALNKKTLRRSSSLWVSNEFAADRAVITAKRGRALIVLSL